MNTDEERIILDYLKGSPDQFFSPSESARRASSKLFRKDPKWAAAPLQRLYDTKLIECDPAGHYCYIDYEAKEKKRTATAKKRMFGWYAGCGAMPTASG